MLRCPECGTPYKQITGGNKQYCSERCRKRAERIRAKEEALRAKEANTTLSREEKAERLAKARRLRAEKQKQSREWRLKHKAEIRKIELSSKKRAVETRQRVAAMQRERTRNKYREMRKPIIAERVKKGWILCKSVCKECGEEFEYVKRTKNSQDAIFCSPTCNRSYHRKHGEKRKYQAKAQQIAQLVRRELLGSKWERMLNPNNSVDRIFIYGY